VPSSGAPRKDETTLNESVVRRADVEDAETIGQLLHDFNREFDEPTPHPSALADRIRMLLRSGESMVLLGGEGPDGLAVLRFRPAIWSAGLDGPAMYFYERDLGSGT